jgi:hypothetical protein
MAYQLYPQSIKPVNNCPLMAYHVYPQSITRVTYVRRCKAFYARDLE